MARGPKAHQKNTLKLILNETKLPFTSVERQVIANVARYHRKSCPRNKDYDFMSLSTELKRKVKILAGILRLADGLDFSHQSIVQRVEAHVAFEYVTIEGVARLSPVVEEFAVNKKKEMFEQFFRKKVVVAWKQAKPLQQTIETTGTVMQEPIPSTIGNTTTQNNGKIETNQSATTMPAP